MARILAVSSYVAHGHVGLGAIVPALQALGHEVVAVPTVVLSNHYGYAACGGFPLPCEQFADVLDGLDRNGLLAGLDAILTGYLPSAAHVDALAERLGRLADKQPDTPLLVDPVLGDDPGGLYVAHEVAEAVRELLLPLADIATPNRFELAWLTRHTIADAADAACAAATLAVPLVVATSVPAGEGTIANVACEGRRATIARVSQRDAVPRGTGDLFAALLLGHVVNSASSSDALARATAGLRRIAEASVGSKELHVVTTIREAATAAPVQLSTLQLDKATSQRISSRTDPGRR